MISSMVAPLMYLFAAPPAGCSKSFLGLKTWFAYFPGGQNSWFGPTQTQAGLSKCDINNNFSLLAQNGHSGLLLIGLALLDDLLQIAALVAVGYVIYGGIQYLTSQGSPDSTSKARQTIINALIGLAIAIVASSIVTFIGNKLG